MIIQSSFIRRGFTLIELLVVIAIIGILATAALALINPFGQFAKAHDAQRKSDLKQIQTALELYSQDNGGYPSNAIMNSLLTTGNPWTPYMQKVPTDPTKKKYFYRQSGAGYQMYASLDNGSDPQACTSASCSLGGTDCGGASSPCNYGVSSSDQTP